MMIVTRFAPSPTGYLHIGGARTALFNWLWAKHNKGKFILRIEDTDVKRNTASATEQVIKDLKWLGIEWDEGPDTGGQAGPYQQSQRLGTYEKYVNQLLDEGKAYYCFDTSEEIQVLRDKARKEKKTFIYPRPEKFPTKEDAEKAKAEGRPVTIRLAINRNKPYIVEDQVRGQVRFEADQMSDFILVKSDGYPTYHFACVVDDELMGVTDVIRGQEHLMNTPYHQALQKALGFRVPRYAHMSVTVSEGGGKLSKRERAKALKKAIKDRGGNVDKEQLAVAGDITLKDVNKFLNGDYNPDMPVVDGMAGYLGVSLPEINVVDFFRSGYVPEAMVNFLAFLGWNPGGEQEIMRREELVDSFELSRVTKTNSLFDRKKLVAFNTEHIKLLDIDTLLGHFRAYLEANNSSVAKGSDEMLKRLLEASRGAKTLADIEAKCHFLFVSNKEIEYDPKAVKKVLLKKRGLEMLAEVRERLANLDEVSEQSLEKMLRGLAEEKEVGLGKVAQPLRVAISGGMVSPPIFDSVELLGLDNTLARIDRTLEKFQE